MTKRILNLLLLLSVAVMGCAQKTYTVTRSVGNFDKISSSSGIDVFIEEGQSSELKVETNYEEYMVAIKTEVRGGELKIGIDDKILNKKPKNMKVSVYLSATHLTAIKASSGSDVYSKSLLNADKIDLQVSSGADIEISLHAQEIVCTASSGGDIEIDGKGGKTDSATLKASSGSDITFKNMTVRRVNAAASSGADIELGVVESELNAKASSGSDIKYKGEPTVNADASSGGSIKRAKK